MVACVIPRAAISYTLYWSDCDSNASAAACLLAMFNSFAFDVFVRQKTTQPSLPLGVIGETVVIDGQAFGQPAAWGPHCLLEAWVIPRVVELSYCAWDVADFASDLGWDGPPFRWDVERRALIRAELDAAFFHLYGLNRDETEYVLDTFPIVRRNDERKFGEYRTKRLILERYDAMVRAMGTGEPYETALDPPPADPQAAHDEDRSEASGAR